jgi:hypothetical protein
MTTEAQAPSDPEGFLNHYFVTKAPFQIPGGGREAIVKFGPWIVVVLLVLSLPALLFILGVGTALVPFGGVGYATGFGLAAIGLCVQIALQVMALPGLFAEALRLAADVLRPDRRRRHIVAVGRDCRSHPGGADRVLHPVSGARAV